ncbi:MAG: hypothetical protein EOR05_20175 [Mesorhizobium sp.]|nr:MAG: hypothetical protein EOR05_20175 [Mesorhizobium sp.]
MPSGLRLSRSELGGARPRPAVGYIFAESRSAREIAGPLGTFGAVLQVDGCRLQDVGQPRRRESNSTPVRLDFCLAHARRKFCRRHQADGLARSARGRGEASKDLSHRSLDPLRDGT